MPTTFDNNRIFYACQAVAIGPEGDNTQIIEAHGVQSVGINTTFNLEQVFELGQIEIYDNIEGIPDVEVTLEKVLDGYPLLYRLCTAPTSHQGTLEYHSLVARAKNKCSAVLAIYPDGKNVVDGVAPVSVYMSGMYLNNVTYTLPVEGNCTESVTLVGNHKQWLPSTGTTTPAGLTLASLFSSTLADKFRKAKGNPTNEGPDFPVNSLNDNRKGGVQRRQHVRMDKSVLPLSIYGVGAQLGSSPNGYYQAVSVTGQGNNWDNSMKCPIAHIQNITISTDLGREDILELGRKAAYYRAPNYPVEVTSEFEVISVSGDFINALENGDQKLWATGVPMYVPHPSGNNTSQETIYIELNDGTAFYLGKKNRLSSVTYGGADAGGGNATMTYSFTTYNELFVQPPGLTTEWGLLTADLTNGAAAKPARETPNRTLTT